MRKNNNCSICKIKTYRKLKSVGLISGDKNVVTPPKKQKILENISFLYFNGTFLSRKKEIQSTIKTK